MAISTQGAAQGAAAGSAFGPWGAAVGGVLGAVGGMGGGGGDAVPTPSPVSGTYGARYYAPINGNQGTAAPATKVNWLYVGIGVAVLVTVGIVVWAFKPLKPKSRKQK